MRQDQSFVLYWQETDHCRSCLLSKNSTWKVLFCTIMTSFEKSVSTSQFPVNKVIKFGPCWPRIDSWLVGGIKNTGSYSRGSLSISLTPPPSLSPSPSPPLLLFPSPFPFPPPLSSPSLFHLPFPLPLPLPFSPPPFLFPRPLPFLRLPRRLNLTNVPKCVSC